MTTTADEMTPAQPDGGPTRGRGQTRTRVTPRRPLRRRAASRAADLLREQFPWVIVVGGGLLGCALLLARGGR